jgi:AAA domain
MSDGPFATLDAVGLCVVTLDEFVAVDEPGASALVGDEDGLLFPEDADVMIYGDGGSGKTTLAIDLGCHLAAGDDWLGLPVPRPVRVLIVENEGPRPLFRAKLRRKRDHWTGAPIGDRLVVLETPWARMSFADPARRELLATVIRDRQIDVVIVGPVSRSGMNEAGTLQEVRDFAGLLDQVRELAGRRVTFVLVHHENKGGKVSGAWEGSGDTLLHVQAEGNGRTRLYVQKARWASALNKTTMHLAWADGEGFAVEERPDLGDEELAERILAAVGERPGSGWTRVEEATPGVNRQRRRDVRDRLLRDRLIVNVVTADGGEQIVLDHCPERRQAHLHLADDPTIAHLRPELGADEAQPAPGPAGEASAALRPAPRPLKRAQGVGAADSPPLDELEWT